MSASAFAAVQVSMRAAEAAVTRSMRYVVIGVGALAVGFLAAGLIEPVAVLLAAAGVLVALVGLRELRPRRRAWRSYEVIAEPDGVTTVFQTSTPFVPGSLIVFIDGIAHATVVEHPASGSFGLGWAPDNGSSLEASWREQ